MLPIPQCNDINKDYTAVLCADLYKISALKLMGFVNYFKINFMSGWEDTTNSILQQT